MDNFGNRSRNCSSNKFGEINQKSQNAVNKKFKIENEIKLINNNIDKMYVDKLNNKISEEMYERLFSKLKNEIKQKENEYIEIKRQKEESKQDDTEKIKSVIQEFLSINKPTSEIMKVIINRIEIHQDKQVDLYFNFKQLNNLKDKV